MKINAHTWPWAASPRNSGWPWPLNLYFCLPLKIGGLPRELHIRATPPKTIKVALRYHRIGIPHSRSHALRHAFACRLVENGSSLKEVADLLRHRSLNTTLIYAKLDTPKLAAVS